MNVFEFINIAIDLERKDYELPFFLDLVHQVL